MHRFQSVLSHVCDPSTFTECLLSGSGGSTGPEAVNSHLNSGSAIYRLACILGQGTDLMREVQKVMPTLQAQGVVTNIQVKQDNQYFFSSKWKIRKA